MKSQTLQYCVDRLKEPSTWRGMCMLCTSIGIYISPEMQDVIIGVGLTIVGLIGVLTKG